MSKTTKRKYVTKEVVEDYYVPEDEEEIVKIIGGRGNNLHEVENAFGKNFLISMPTKFRKNVWVKRGDFVVMVPIKEGKKVQGEIVYILLAKQIKYLKDQNLWPKEFGGYVEKEEPIKAASQDVTMNSDSDSSCDELFENTNRRPVYRCNDETEDSSEEEESNEDEDIDDGDGPVNEQYSNANGLDET